MKNQSKTKRAPGGGRKPKYGEPGETITFRVPEKYHEQIKALVRDFLRQKSSETAIEPIGRNPPD